MRNKLFGTIAASFTLLMGGQTLAATVNPDQIKKSITKKIKKLEQLDAQLDKQLIDKVADNVLGGWAYYVLGKQSIWALYSFSGQSTLFIETLAKKIDTKIIALIQKGINKLEAVYNNRLQTYKNYAFKMIDQKMITHENLKTLSRYWQDTLLPINQISNIRLFFKHTEKERKKIEKLLKKAYKKQEDVNASLQAARDTSFVQMLKYLEPHIEPFENATTLTDLEQQYQKAIETLSSLKMENVSDQKRIENLARVWIENAYENQGIKIVNQQIAKLINIIQLMDNMILNLAEKYAKIARKAHEKMKKMKLRMQAQAYHAIVGQIHSEKLEKKRTKLITPLENRNLIEGTTSIRINAVQVPFGKLTE